DLRELQRAHMFSRFPPGRNVIDSPFLTELPVGGLHKRHATFICLLVRHPLMDHLLLHVAASFVEQPASFGTDELESREMRAHAVIDIAEIAEESHIQYTDPVDQFALQQNCIP